MARRPDKPADRGSVNDPDRSGLRQIRTAAIVMAATMVLWVAGQYIGGQLGWPVRFAFLLDLAAIAALLWAMIVTYFVWKARRKS